VTCSPPSTGSRSERTPPGSRCAITTRPCPSTPSSERRRCHGVSQL
jgi:hypothetical protein